MAPEPPALPSIAFADVLGAFELVVGLVDVVVLVVPVVLVELVVVLQLVVGLVDVVVLVVPVVLVELVVVLQLVLLQPPFEGGCSIGASEVDVLDANEEPEPVEPEIGSPSG